MKKILNKNLKIATLIIVGVLITIFVFWHQLNRVNNQITNTKDSSIIMNGNGGE